MNYETISIIGLGYIGLPTAAMFASRKMNVIGVDVNQGIIDKINCGNIHIIEPDLDHVVKAVVADGRLRATTVPEPADAFVIAVPTPFTTGPSGPHHPDLSYIEAASRSIAPVLKRGDLVILESTSPVGATEKMAAWLASVRTDLSFPQTHGESSDIRIAYCPERVLPGQVMRELIFNDRVIGGLTAKCSAAAASLYRIFLQGNCIVTDARTAEMCKLTENSYRDVNIAFANELSIICEKLNINVWELLRLANRHPRVNILQPGPGVGGHCIAVDPWFIVSDSPDEAKLIRVARQINDMKPDWVISKIEMAIEEQLLRNAEKKPEDITIAFYGLSFKANIDDLRESPALSIVRKCAANLRCALMIVEPHISELPNDLKDFGKLVDHVEAQRASDIIVLLVGHTAFRYLSFETNPIVLDTVGLLQRDQA